MISPLPWRVCEFNEDNSIRIYDAEDKVVVYAYDFLSLEDAYFIVDAANSYKGGIK